MWVAANKDGSISLFVNKPVKHGNSWFDYQSKFFKPYLTLPKQAFPQLNWEHEPIEVVLTTEDSQQYLYDLGYREGYEQALNDNYENKQEETK